MDVGAIISSVNLLGLIGFGYLVKGLKQRIENLTLANEQKETLDAVRTRATELDQLRKDYRQGLEDFQALGKKLDERRAELVKELEDANKAKDNELARLKTLQLEELNLRKQSLESIPGIEQRLTATVEELQKQIALVSASPAAKLSARKRHYFPWALVEDAGDAEIWNGPGYLAGIQRFARTALDSRSEEFPEEKKRRRRMIQTRILRKRTDSSGLGGQVMKGLESLSTIWRDRRGLSQRYGAGFMIEHVGVRGNRGLDLLARLIIG